MSDPGSPARRRRVQASLPGLLASTSERAADLLDPRDAAGFLARLAAVHADVFDPVDALYGPRGTEQLVERLVGVALQARADRPQELRLLDDARAADPQYWHRSAHVGYVCYADRFAGGLAGIGDHADHLASLGVTYLHLMPLLRPRDGDSDGGYAVADYRDVDPALGTVADLEAVTAALRDRGVSLCVDLVLNHTAREHPWAQAARRGDERYRRYYRVYPTREEPDAWEATLPDVFPDTAPGSFTWDDDMDGWVWTSFHDYQWDLDWSNPDVFAEMLDVALWVANRGVEVLRLDAVPFLWKRKGTDCQNQPEAHWVLQAVRALTRLAAPACQLKAEAIVPPGELVQYLGGHDRYRPECDLAYHNQLMVQSWSAVAARDARTATAALRRMRPVPPGAGWVTYVRCHDDIGWAVDDEDAAAAGGDGFSHRRFLADFYAGGFAGSFARGAKFQEDEVTGDARTSGTAAALAGLQQAEEVGDDRLADVAVRRLLLLHAIAWSFGGIPLLYMGDEVSLPNDETYLRVPAQAEDNRWMHRPWMDWERVAAARADPASPPGRLLAGVAELSEARRRLAALSAGGSTSACWTDATEVLAYRRRHPRSGPLLVLANVADRPTSLSEGVLHEAGVGGRPVVALASRTLRGGHDPLDVREGRVHLPPLGWLWLAPDDGTVEPAGASSPGQP